MLLPLLLNNVLSTAGSTDVEPSGIAATTAFGTAQLDQTLPLSGAAPSTALGTPTVAYVQQLIPWGINDTALGSPTARYLQSLAPSSIASTTLGTPTLAFGGIPLQIEPTGINSFAFGSTQVESVVSATSLSTSLSTAHKPTLARFRNYGYVANGWDTLKRWDGRSTSLVDAGIVGPSADLDSWTTSPSESAGNCNVGIHVVRYRYLDSTTGYVSNPSEEREVEVTSGNGTLTFNINTSGASNIIRSTDSKVDKIVIEMTTAGSSVFYQAAETLQTASTVAVSISDAELEVSFLPWPDVGHDVPPVASTVTVHRDRVWLYGQVVHSTGNADFTNASADVDEGSTAPEWSEDALGAAAGEASVTWLIQKEGDDTAYEISYADNGNNKIVLTDTYGGSTTTDSSYKIFSRANVIWVSEPGYPESFSPLKFINGPTEEITAGLGYGFSMIFYTQSSMFKIGWEQGPLVDPVQSPLSQQYGALNQQCVVEVEGTLYAMDKRSWTAWRGSFPRVISDAISAEREQIDYSKSDCFHATYFPELRAIRWHVIYTGDSYPKNYVQFDLKTQTWSTGTFNHEVSTSALVPTAEGLRVLYGDSSGHLWWADTGNADGCRVTDSRTTISTGATTTVLPTAATNLTVIGPGLAGCYAYVPSLGEARQITSNTTSQVTVGTAFSSAPADGAYVWIGTIPSRLKTRAYRARKLRGKRRTTGLNLEFTPLSSSRQLQVRTFDDLGSTARSSASATGRNNPDAVTWPGSDTNYPSTDFLVDMSEADGQATVPLGNDFRRYVEIEIEIQEPDAPIEITDLMVDGDDLNDPKD